MKLLVFILLLFAASAILLAGDRDTTMRVLKSDKGIIVAQPILPAIFGFRLEAGSAPPEGIIRCKQHTDYRTLQNVRYPVLLLKCDGGRILVLTDVDLGAE